MKLLALMPSEHCHQTGCHIFQHLQITKMHMDVAGLGAISTACLLPLLMPTDSGSQGHRVHAWTQTKCRMSGVWPQKCVSFVGVNWYF